MVALVERVLFLRRQHSPLAWPASRLGEAGREDRRSHLRRAASQHVQVEAEVLGRDDLRDRRARGPQRGLVPPLCRKRHISALALAPQHRPDGSRCRCRWRRRRRWRCSSCRRHCRRGCYRRCSR